LRVSLKNLGLNCLDFNLNSYFSRTFHKSILVSNKLQDIGGRKNDLSDYIYECINDSSFLFNINKKNMSHNKLTKAILYSTITELRPYLKKFINFFMKPSIFEIIGRRVKNYMVQLLNKGRKINVAKVRR